MVGAASPAMASQGRSSVAKEVEHPNKRFAELRDNWPELWAREGAAAADGRDN